LDVDLRTPIWYVDSHTIFHTEEHAMDKRELQRIKNRKRALEKRLSSLTPLMRGSVVELSTTCGQANCRCARGDKHKKVYFSMSAKGKTKLIYLGKERAAIAAQYAANYKVLAELVDELTIINMDLLKADVIK